MIGMPALPSSIYLGRADGCSRMEDVVAGRQEARGIQGAGADSYAIKSGAVVWSNLIAPFGIFVKLGVVFGFDDIFDRRP